MKLFISYARVDKPYCIQIVNTLDVHDTWYDQRLHAGQNWWKEILHRLDWCEGFVYLLSPDSIQSEYCRKEFELARHLGRHIFPVLIHRATEIPSPIQEVQYVDFTGGLTADAVKTLLNSLYLAEHERAQPVTAPVAVLTSESMKPPSANPVSAISAATAAMAKGQFDHAVFLLKRAQAAGHSSRFINIEAVLIEAEAGLQRQTYLREAAREYEQIVDLVKFDRTHKLGCEAFTAFRKHYPDYDPENLASLCASAALTISTSTAPDPGKVEISPAPPKIEVPEFKLPLLEWCEVPARLKEVPKSSQNGHVDKQQIEIPAFKISRYPVTNAQYRAFLDDPAGYANKKWWQFSPEAQEWRGRSSEAQPPTFKGDERPRERVNWYDAMAFCAWLSTRLDMKVSLPSDMQWIRAAQGDTKRPFPWGEAFDKQRCNTRESEIKMTTLVIRYPTGASPFGVMDMAGNVWEWCLESNTEAQQNGAAEKRLVHGGSYISPFQRSEIEFRYYLDPHSFHSTIGFRLVVNAL